MTTREQDFMRDLKAVLEKHSVTFAADGVYYPGDDDNKRFVLPNEEGQTVITIDDMAELRGGWN